MKMKKILQKLFLLALSVILVLSITACGGDMNNSSDDYVSSNDSKTPLESELSPSKNDNLKPDNNGNIPSQNQTTQPNGMNSGGEAKISKEEAKKIALKDAGLTESEIRDFEIELDRDNGVLKYEISFEKGNDDYDYDIDANSGKILKKEKDQDQ
jgi:uncharacterized membrane protein YkoI